MSRYGPVHPLDVDLADLVDGIADDARAAELEAHLADCLLCRIKRQRLRGAPPAGPGHPSRSLSSPTFTVPRADAGAGDPSRGEFWLAGQGVLVVVLADVDGGRVLVAPVTFDVELADDETVVVAADRSPLSLALAIYPALATEVPAAALAGRVGRLANGDDLAAVLAGTGPGVSTGSPIQGPTDPRLELRQYLADALGGLEETPLDPDTAADAPALPRHHVASALIAGVRSLRGTACAVRAVDRWDDVLAAERNGWAPLATLDEVGVVLVVLDTPHGLTDDADFDAARSVLTRYNASALVVLAQAISELAEVFDSASLNHGIDMPSGAHTPPRPLISGLYPSDAIAKYLDQHTGAKAMVPASRGPVTRVDVGSILGESAAAAVADVVRQGSRFKIAPKRSGYESLAADEGAVAAALARAFTAEESVVEALLELARRDAK